MTRVGWTKWSAWRPGAAVCFRPRIQGRAAEETVGGGVGVRLSTRAGPGSLAEALDFILVLNDL